MPISIAPAPPGSAVGPGIALVLSSDFIGPLPADSEYQVDITSIPGELLVWEERMLWVTNPHAYWLGTGNDGARSTGTFTSVDAGTSVNIAVALSDGTHIVDTGSATAIWQPTLGLGFQMTRQPTSSLPPSPDPRIDQILAAVIRRLEDQR